MKMAPDDTAILCYNAWCISTSVNEKYNDSNIAVELATRINEKSNWEVAPCLICLSVAYAEDGQFEKAIETLKSAREVASPEEVPLIEVMASEFKKGKLYRVIEGRGKISKRVFLI